MAEDGGHGTRAPHTDKLPFQGPNATTLTTFQQRIRVHAGRSSFDQLQNRSYEHMHAN